MLDALACKLVLRLARLGLNDEKGKINFLVLSKELKHRIQSSTSYLLADNYLGVDAHWQLI